MSPGDRTLVIHERARRHHWSGEGRLSIKSFPAGHAYYNTGKGFYRVASDSYLLLNDGTRYSISIDSDSMVESLCVFFRRGLAEDVKASLFLPAERLLDGPDRAGSERIAFFEKTFPHDSIVTPILNRFRGERRKHPDGDTLECLARELLQAMLVVHGRATLEAGKLSCLRASTRDEVFRRLHRAREYVTACYDEPVSISDMARVACMSPNHFIRSFRELFNQTPHQFLAHIRILRAREILDAGDRSVSETCLAVGFSSLGSFSRLFKRITGTSPSDYGNRKR